MIFIHIQIFRCEAILSNQNLPDWLTRQLAILTYIDQLNQPESTRINPYQPISTRINLYQPVSTCINPYQPISTCINPYQLISTCIINQYQLIPTCTNPYQLYSLYRFLLVLNTPFKTT